MSGIKIIKASAGSGKTHTLAQSYIDLLLPDEISSGDRFDKEGYKHILAVTFTNKATREMKERIIENLYKLSKGSGLRERRAKEVLIAILHDYSRFSVSTIDRFFQTVMRAFAREIGVFSSYGVELDTKAVAENAVDVMLDSLSEDGNGELLEWLTRFSLHQAEAGRNWNITGELKKVALLFMKEEFKVRLRAAGGHYGDIGDFAALASELDNILDSDASEMERSTAAMMKEQFFLMGICNDLYRNVNSYLKENNLVLLGNTADTLNRIIDGSDTPFIYEKTGIRYDHFMLDEFQDTSLLQWLNFKPLLGEGISRGCDSLVVGDVKQSIYRWRNSDLRLLDSRIDEDFADSVEHMPPLLKNWRSAGRIVEFNNSFFSHIGGLISAVRPEEGEAVSRYYSDVVQEVARPERNDEGYVRVTFVPRKDEDGEKQELAVYSLGRIEADMKRLTASFRPCDIAYLVRTGAEGAMVSAKLLSLGYNVVTEDSLRIGASSVVSRLIALLRRDADPSGKNNAILLAAIFGPDGIPPAAASPAESLYIRCETLIRDHLSPVSPGEALFVSAFLDEVNAFTSRYGSDLAEFLRWWDESGNDKTISASQGENSVRVMTIHKSKGLDFPVVVIPFLRERFALRGDPVWFTPEQPPFNRAGVVALAPKSEMENTIFAAEYRQEKTMTVIDAVNTVYVAMTRPSKALIIYAHCPVFTKKGNYDARYLCVADMLYGHLTASGALAGDTVEFGKLPAPLPDAGYGGHDGADALPASGPGLTPSAFFSIPLGERLKLRLGGPLSRQREEGIVKHAIISEIVTAADIPAAVRAAVSRGELEAGEEGAMVDFFNALIAGVAGYGWFDGSMRSLSEISIADAEGGVHRPDRILVEGTPAEGNGRAVVIDFKFGLQRRREYEHQVKRYMKLIKDMGYGRVEGYIWYCEAGNEVVKV